MPDYVTKPVLEHPFNSYFFSKTNPIIYQFEYFMFNDSGWSYSTSSGLSGAVTVTGPFEVSGGQTRLYVTSPSGDLYKIIGTGLGFGIGKSLLPAGIAGSEASYASSGSDIYAIYNDPITIDDLSGLWVIYSVSGMVTTLGGSASLVLFVHLTTWQKINLATSSVAGVTGILASLTGAAKAFCVCAGAQLGSPNLGADGTGNVYYISSAEMIKTAQEIQDESD